jgi:ABC-type phosphate/phosphonate transport system permease subunit
MVTPFFNRLNLKREENLSTKSAGQMFLQFSKIIAFTGAAGVNFLKLKENIALILVGTLVGIALSFPISKKISDIHFSKLVNFLLGLISVKIIIEGIREYFV